MDRTPKKEEFLGRGLVDKVFSWSITDVLNENLYQDQVKKIPDTFSSTSIYMDSFILPLLEETRADLLSSMNTVQGSEAPICEITNVRKTMRFQLPTNLSYDLLLLKKQGVRGAYMPVVGDLIALTNVRPKCIDDLNKPYVIAYVRKMEEYESIPYVTVLSSKLIMADGDHGMDHKKNEIVFGVYLTNLYTNIRIWSSLNGELIGGNMKIIHKVLQGHSSGSSYTCAQCRLGKKLSSEIEATTSYSDLNDSQRDAILSCINLVKCHHVNTIKLIRGPPGTGKTTTVSVMLSSLLKLNCRTLTCAPTNVAVLEIAKRVLKQVRKEGCPRFGSCYGLGDIVLFGNEKRMDMDNHNDLNDVFLDYRVNALGKCLGGWKYNLSSMISLLEDPKQLYNQYLEEINNGKGFVEAKKGKKVDTSQSEKNEHAQSFKPLTVEEFLSKRFNSNNGKGFVEAKKGKKVDTSQSEKNEHAQSFKPLTVEEFLSKRFNSNNGKGFVEAKKGKKVDTSQSEKNEHAQSFKPLTVEEFLSKRFNSNNGKGFVEAKKGKKVDTSQSEKNEHAQSFKPLTFEEFLSEAFNSLHEELTFCIVNLYKHLPSSSILQEDMMNMFRAHDLLHSLEALFGTENGFLSKMFCDHQDTDSDGDFSKWGLEIKECLHVLKLLPKNFSFLQVNLREFCLSKACLIFSTVSGSTNLHKKEMSPIEILVIDEAAMLKECESTIPLQLNGIRHTILIGDDRQLPAMVQSKICGKAEFGRSLFERLVQLGHKKHLLKVQHRMHPTISLFPNKEFYESEIVDAQSVKEVGYNKSFLPGNMYGSYSFIDVPMGKEELDNNHSRRNMVEVIIVYELVKKLHEECVRRKTKVRVGVISPYKAQVSAIENKMKKFSFSGGFEVNVRSVDGFQGGEEDVIIISTVRSNENGSIGFLSDRRRVNVALTRARHCLWILGNGTTLINSETVWKTLVIDAKNRGNFYKAQEDKCLSMALLYSLVELKEMVNLRNVVSSFFGDAIWKVCFSDKFWHSMGRVGNRETFKQVLFILENLSNGLQEINNSKKKFVYDGISSQLLEQYNVNKRLNLIWTVDILEENLQCTQVIMVWDLLPHSEINKLAEHVDLVYNSYTTVKIDRCKYKCLHGNLVYPMRWPMDSKNSELHGVNLSKSPSSIRIAENLKIREKSNNSELHVVNSSKSFSSIRIAENLKKGEKSNNSELHDENLSKSFASGRIAENINIWEKFCLWLKKLWGDHN